MNNLPKPRKFSGEQQVQILIDIAKSRETNQKLIIENKRLKRDLDALKKQSQEDFAKEREVCKKMSEKIGKLENEVVRLLCENASSLNTTKKCRQALEYYANPENYKGIPLIKKAQVLMDNGEFARYVLDGESNE
jgi:hypothetical protein